MRKTVKNLCQRRGQISWVQTGYPLLSHPCRHAQSAKPSAFRSDRPYSILGFSCARNLEGPHSAAQLRAHTLHFLCRPLLDMKPKSQRWHSICTYTHFAYRAAYRSAVKPDIRKNYNEGFLLRQRPFMSYRRTLPHAESKNMPIYSQPKHFSNY